MEGWLGKENPAPALSALRQGRTGVLGVMAEGDNALGPHCPLSLAVPLETVTTELAPDVGRESTQVTRPSLGPAWQSLPLCGPGTCPVAMERREAFL